MRFAGIHAMECYFANWLDTPRNRAIMESTVRSYVEQREHQLEQEHSNIMFNEYANRFYPKP